MALDLPDDARRQLAAWRDRLTHGHGDLRPVAPGALHVTLVFLGWQDESEVEAIAEASFGAVPGIGAPLLTPGELRAVPPGRPRLFALDLHDEAGRAAAVHDALSEALEAGGWYRPEARPFWPHVTLARVRRGARRVAAPAGPPAPGEPFRAARLTLYRSTLRHQGPAYEAQGAIALR